MASETTLNRPDADPMETDNLWLVRWSEGTIPPKGAELPELSKTPTDAERATPGGDEGDG